LDLNGNINEPIIKNEIKYKPKKTIISKDLVIIDKIKQKMKETYHKYNNSNDIILISPYAGVLPIRAWQPTYYIELSKKILNNYENALIVITGTTSAKKLHNEIEKSISDERCINLTGKTTLTEYIQLCHTSKYIITADGGAAHFAATTDIKGLVFFGPETPLLYKPISDNIEPIYLNYNCSPCLNAFNYRITNCKNNLCLKNISVDYIFQKIKLTKQIKT
jgi:ADP-heptose:LPS heptosyltransferase